MQTNYASYAKLIKSINAPIRLQIIDMLSCGELCACVIWEKFDIAQPTLSHHMNILCKSGIVIPRKEGKWTFYKLNKEKITEITVFLDKLSTTKEDCICKEDCSCGK